MSNIPLPFFLRFIYNPNEKWKFVAIWCDLETRAPQSYHHQPQLERKRDRQRGEMEESALESQREPWITSSLIKSHCTQWACSPRRGRSLVSQRASSVSLYHANTCEALCQPPSTANQPTHYYKPHTLAHHCYTEWTVDWRRELLCVVHSICMCEMGVCVFVHVFHVTDGG